MQTISPILLRRKRQYRAAMGTLAVLLAAACLAVTPAAAQAQSASLGNLFDSRSVEASSALSGGFAASRGARQVSDSELLPKPVVSLFVSARDPQELTRNLQTLINLKRRSGVELGSVYVIGTIGELMSGNALTTDAEREVNSLIENLKQGPVSTMSSEPSTRTVASPATGPNNSGNFADSAAYKLLEKAGIDNSKLVSVDSLLRQYKISASPTWVISHLGRQQVFEGFDSPAEGLRQLYTLHTPKRSVVSPPLVHSKRASKISLHNPGGEQSLATSSMGLLFEMALSREHLRRNELLLSYRELPACKEAKVDLVQVHNDTVGSSRFDFVYYNPYDAEQVSQAKQYAGYAIPYSPMLLKDPSSGQANPVQGFARMVNVECLPTRFNFVTVGGSRYASYRLGAEAWK